MGKALKGSWIWRGGFSMCEEGLSRSPHHTDTLGNGSAHRGCRWGHTSMITMLIFLSCSNKVKFNSALALEQRLKRGKGPFLFPNLGCSQYDTLVKPSDVIPPLYRPSPPPTPVTPTFPLTAAQSDPCWVPSCLSITPSALASRMNRCPLLKMPNMPASTWVK